MTLTFSNGEVRVFDVKPYLNIGIFRELQDKRLFNSVWPVLGSIQWQNGQDFCPDTLYLDGVPTPGLGRWQPDQPAPRARISLGYGQSTDLFASGNVHEESFYAEAE